VNRPCLVPSAVLKCEKTNIFKALGYEVELVSKDAFLGDKFKVFYRENCGYVESYRDKKRRP
jgi:hypothetical protein